MEQRWCVYVLRDPRDGRVRYVGMTGNERQRKSQHRTFSYGSWEKRYWTACVRICGKQVQFEVVSRHNSKQEALDAECELILWYQKNHPGQLVSTTLKKSKNGFYVHRGGDDHVNREMVEALEFIAGHRASHLKFPKGSFLGLLT